MKKWYDRLFPLFLLIRANKKINDNMQNFKSNLEDEDYMSDLMRNFQNISEHQAHEIFNRTIENRKSLEEKAKSNILIVTVAITVILGVSSLLFSIPEKVTNQPTVIISLGVLFILSLIYMIIGSILSLKTLNSGELKEKYDLSPQDLSYIASLNNDQEKENEKKYMLSSYTELNNYINFKLNNYASCTYEHIRNSLITFFLIGVLITGIFIFSDKDKKPSVEDRINEQNKILEGIKTELNGIGESIYDSQKKENLDIKNLNEKQAAILENINDICKKVDVILADQLEENRCKDIKND